MLILLTKTFHRFRYELIAALIGAVILMLELVGARLIAPYFGTSLYVWTSVIGVILGALSVGYVYGGRWADRGPSDNKLAAIIFISALLLLISQLSQEFILSSLAALSLDLRLQAFLAALILFAPANFFFGVVSPYLVKLRLTSLASAGRSIGGLYAAGTVGSIVGTFLAGYFLISYVGSRKLGLLMVGVLVLVSLLAMPNLYRKQRIGLLMIAVVFALVATGPDNPAILYDGDSIYARNRVVDVTTSEGKLVRQLRTDHLGVQSAVMVEDPSLLVAPYNQQFFEVARAAAKLDNVLVIGGGTFTFPRVLSERFPKIQVDVVEIDPQLEQIAKSYFFYRDNKRINIKNEDGRTFLNRNKKQYDLIFMDAYTSLSPPFQLTTTEAVARIKASLKPDGAAVINLISAYEGEAAQFLKATATTYKTAFKRVEYYQTVAASPLKSRQNIVVYATNGDVRRPSGIKTPALPPLSLDKTAQLTDDYAPVERMTHFR